MTRGDSEAPQWLDLNHHLNHAKVHVLTGLNLARKGFGTRTTCLAPDTNTSPQGLIHCHTDRAVFQQTSNSNFYDWDKKVTQCNTPAEFCIQQIKNKSPAY